MKKFFLIISSIMLLAAASYATAATKFGTVDYREVNKQTDFASKMRSSYQQEVKKFYQPIVEARKQLTENKKRLNDKGTTLSKAARTKLEKQIKTEQADLTKRQAQLRKESVDFRKNIMDRFQDKLKNAVGRIAKRQNIEIVLQKSSVLYANHTVDLTTQVVAALKADPEFKNLPAAAAKPQPKLHRFNKTINPQR